LELGREEAPSLGKEMSKTEIVTEICAKAEEVEWHSGVYLGQREENRHFGSTIHALLHELSSWKQEEIFLGGISLELVTGSLSHWQRLAKACDFVACGHPILIGDRHVDIIRQRDAITGTVLNFCDMIDLELGPSTQLSKVPAISSLFVSDQNPAGFSRYGNHVTFDPDVVRKLMSALPALRNFNWGVKPRTPLESKLYRLAENGPSTLRDIRIAQQAPLWLTTVLINPWVHSENRLAKQAQHLAYLCSNFPINAFSFFEACSERQYPELRCLAIRSSTFDRFFDIARLPPPTLLRLVAASISRMPKLEHLIVFTRGRCGEEAGLIIYNALDAGKTYIDLLNHLAFRHT
jgi:hypothetical protein